PKVECQYPLERSEKSRERWFALRFSHNLSNVSMLVNCLFIPNAHRDKVDVLDVIGFVKIAIGDNGQEPHLGLHHLSTSASRPFKEEFDGIAIQQQALSVLCKDGAIEIGIVFRVEGAAHEERPTMSE